MYIDKMNYESKLKKIKSGLERLGIIATGTGIGGGVGYLVSLYGKIAAEANVKVRPELANVSLWEAFLAKHLDDWLFYHYPSELTLIITSIAALIGGGIAYKISKKWNSGAK